MRRHNKRRTHTQVRTILAAARRMELALHAHNMGFLHVDNDCDWCEDSRCSLSFQFLEVRPVGTRALMVGNVPFRPFAPDGPDRCRHTFLRRLYSAYIERDVARLIQDALGEHGERGVVALVLEYARDAT